MRLARLGCAHPMRLSFLRVLLRRVQREGWVFDPPLWQLDARGVGRAVRLDPAPQAGRRQLDRAWDGPFLVRHPNLLNNWIAARETALTRVRALPLPAPFPKRRKTRPPGSPRMNCKSASLPTCARFWIASRIGWRIWPGHEPLPWDALWRTEAKLTREEQEALVSLLIEPHGPRVDDLVDAMGTDEAVLSRLDGAMTLGGFGSLLARNYAWALQIDFGDPASEARPWYVSEEKLEPRLGEHFGELGAELEQPLCIARMASVLHHTLVGLPDDMTLAAFLLQYPQHRAMARRVQMTRHAPYAEIRDNLTAADVLPIDMMRWKLAFFGASHFDPRADKWVRISLFQNEPSPSDFGKEAAA